MLVATLHNEAEMPDSDFAYVPKNGSKSDRKFPISDPNHIRNAADRINQSNIPSSELPKVKAKICSAAKKHNIELDMCKTAGASASILSADDITKLNKDGSLNLDPNSTYVQLFLFR